MSIQIQTIGFAALDSVSGEKAGVTRGGGCRDNDRRLDPAKRGEDRGNPGRAVRDLFSFGFGTIFLQIIRRYLNKASYLRCLGDCTIRWNIKQGLFNFTYKGRL